MRSFRLVNAGLGVALLTSIFATQALGASRIAYSLELGGKNNRDAWKAGSRVAYTRGTSADGQVFYTGDVNLNYAVVMEASGIHSQPGHPSDGKEIFGAANLVFNLELLDANDQPVTNAIFLSTINDGTGSDPLAAAAFSLSFTNFGVGRLIDPTSLGGPRLEPIFTYPTNPPSSGKLIGMGAGFKEWVRTGSGITMPGVGMVTVPPPPSNPTGARRTGFGIVPIAEGQIRIADMTPGTYKLRVSAGNGNNVLRGDLDMVAATNRPAFAVAANDWSTPYTQTFVVEPGFPCEGVKARHLFYNNSKWDNNGTAVTSADWAAIAPNKHPLLPGAGVANIANFSNYSKGITGIIVDACNFSRVPVMDEDIWIAMDNTTTVTPWNWVNPAPAPASIEVFPGQGLDGSDRLVITWADNAIPNAKWVMVWLFAGDGSLGLPADDAFAFGNVIGDVTGDGYASSQDFDQVVQNPTPPNGAAIDNPRDFNRDRRVSSGDTDAILANPTNPGTRLKMISW